MARALPFDLVLSDQRMPGMTGLELQAELGLSMLFISHNLAVVRYVASRVAAAVATVLLAISLAVIVVLDLIQRRVAARG